MTNATEFEIIYEEIPPAPPREGGKGREPIKWENLLAPLKDNAGKSARLWSYAEKTAAVSRMTGVRNRLVEATPEDNWTLKVRPVPDSDPLLHGVYVEYVGTYTPDQVAENAKKRQERSDQAKERFASRQANPEPTPQTVITTPKAEAAKKVAAARSAKK